MNCLRCSSMPCRPWLGRVPVLTIINGNFRFLSLQRLLFGSHETYNELSTQLSTSSVAVYREAFRGLCPYCPTIVCVPFPMAHLKDFLRFLWNLILFRRSFHISILLYSTLWMLFWVTKDFMASCKVVVSPIFVPCFNALNTWGFF